MSDFEYLVSVIVPTHGRRNLVLKLLNALSQQTLSIDRFEILLVHNYTDDGTREAILKWAESTPLKLTYHQKNYKSPTASRQFGADNARGKFIAFIDDDCIPKPYWLSEGIAAFDCGDSPPVGLVQGKTIPNPEQSRRFLEKTVIIDKPSIFFETCNIFYSRYRFNEVGGFSTEFMDKFYGEDTDLGWKIKMSGLQTKFADKALVYHEVFQVSYWGWLKEALFFKNLPYLARKFPDFREHMFAGYFLSVETACFNLLILGLLLSLFGSGYFFLLVLPYFIGRYRSGSHMPNRLLRVVRIVAGLPRSFFIWAALTIGSLRYRSLLI